jgi:hypothetical protein
MIARRLGDPMQATNWQSYVAMGDRESCPADLKVVLAAADDADCDGDFDLGEPWDADFDPTDDDPE